MCRGNLPVHVVIEALEETLAEVHIADGVNGAVELHGARLLSVVAAPVVLDALKMPLVHENNDLLALSSINLLVEIKVALVDEDLLQSGEEDVCALDVPVDQVLVKALLGEGLGSNLSNLLTVGNKLLSPVAHLVLESLPDVVRHLGASLVIQSLSGNMVHFVTHEVELGANLLSCFASILDLETGEPELEVEAEAEVELESLIVEGPSGKEEDLPGVPIELDPLVAVLGQVVLISAHLFLRIHELEELRLVPPTKEGVTPQ